MSLAEVSTQVEEELRKLRRKVYARLLVGAVIGLVCSHWLYPWWASLRSITDVALVGLVLFAVTLAPAAAFALKVVCPRCGQRWFSHHYEPQKHGAEVIWMLGHFRFCGHCGLRATARAHDGDA